MEKNMGRVLLVTGASSEIGRELIASNLNRYVKIYAHYCNGRGKLDEFTSSINDERIVPIQADFRDRESTQNLIETILRTEIMPNEIVHLSSLRAEMIKFQNEAWEKFQDEFNTSIRSIMLILRNFLPNMAKQKYGKVLFMLSAYTIGVAPKYQSHYITTKYALLGLMKSLASEYAGKGISINSISPEMMETEFVSNISQRVIYLNAERNPLGRNILIEEVIPTVNYLLSEASNAITGQNIAITGGR